MSDVFIYIVEFSTMTTVFYLIYWLFLRKETFFSFNRFYLLGSLMVAIVLPIIQVDFFPEQSSVKQTIEGIRADVVNTILLNENAQNLMVEGSIPVYLQILGIVYFIGVLICLSRMVYTLVWMWRLSRKNATVRIGDAQVVKLSKTTTPFSFFRWVFISEEEFNSKDFDKILAHERTHIREFHSIDLLIVQIIATLLWFHPIIWSIHKSLKKTHEYLADRNTINLGYSLSEYQTLLLHQLININSYGLVHFFNLSFIKNRITMMSIKKSGLRGRMKLVVGLGIVMTLCLAAIQTNSQLHRVEVVQESDGVKLYLDMKQIDFKKGFSYDYIKSEDFTGNMVLRVDKEVQADTKLQFTLVNEGLARGTMELEVPDLNMVFNISPLLAKASKGDKIIVEIKNVFDELKILSIDVY